MLNARQNIKENARSFIPEELVELINISVERRITEEDILKLISYSDTYENSVVEFLNRNRQLKINSFKEALGIFGPEHISFVLLNILMFELTGVNEINELRDLYEMQIFTASSGYIIAKESRIQYPHLAYISGMLSNISYFYLARFHPAELKKLLSKDKNMVKRMTFEWETFGLDHAEMSYLILGSVGVLPEIYNPVRYHHQKNLQENIGADHIKDLSLALYFGSMLTNMFYEDMSIVTDFRKDIKNMMEINSRQLEKIIDGIIDNFKDTAASSGLKDLSFPGYFKVISWFDTKLSILNSQMEFANKKNQELNLQNSKYQKALEDNNKKLVGIALTDPLTGAFNRRYLDERLHDEFLKAKRYNQTFILISCDIDHFKVINDTYGHAFGDTVLVKIVQIIKSTIRKTDYISRTGGEEFVVVCHSSNELGGIIIAEKMRKVIESTVFKYEEKTVPVTMSFGVAKYFPEVKSAEELIRISDDRLYAAKNGGRNKVVYK
ncbi:MAG: diguanylate cyclase [Candidatus Delongbacteria bacterium]|nr:diguanylate cyclase [Candidatus Delongbacteria bacterium]